ncbi:peptide deformylase [Cypionkella psychrotolerans]|uniref:peptide deformylase n=1 Tax=Cypionkella psychrotolerans TaxID=1678131 RepID=UPI0006B41AA7|nr:peptide deformylase [Cypionkella psychrotolerans]
MIRDILIHPDPRLKKPCEPIAAVSAEISALASDMFETMYEAPGIGLAAPQIGVMKRLIVMDCIKDGPPEPMALLNPQVLWSSEDLGSYEEGCLSIPDQYAEVKRPSSVKVGWMDLDGVPQERLFTGLWATCVQHEIDHLNGKLFIDYLGPLKRQMITRKMEKLKRERARSGSEY